MIDERSQISSLYDSEGYFVLRDYFAQSEILSLREVILKFHEVWKQNLAECDQ